MVKLLSRICASYATCMSCLLWLVYVNLNEHHHSSNVLRSNETTNPPPQSRMTTTQPATHTNNAGDHHNLTAWLYRNSSKFNGQLRCGADVRQSDQKFASSLSEGTDENPFPFNVKIGCALGTGRTGVDVVMGLPTAKRPGNVTYLHVTLRSLLGHVLARNEDRVAVVVFVVDFDDGAFVLRLLEETYDNFTRQIHNGMLQVITSAVHLQPTAQHLDAGPYAEWMTKQNLHAAYVMNFCKDKGKFYLMLEDDVMAAVGYGEAIFQFLRKRRADEKLMWASTAKADPRRPDYSLGKLLPKDQLPALLSYVLAKRFSKRPIATAMSQYLTEYRNSRAYKLTHADTRSLTPDIQAASIIKHIGRRPSSPVGRASAVDMRSVYADLYGEASFNKPTPNPEAALTPTRDQVDFHFSPADSKTAAKRFFDTMYGDPHPWHAALVPAPEAKQTIRIDFVRVQRVTKLLVKSGRARDGAGKVDGGCAVLKYCQVIRCVRCATFYRNGEAECRLDGVKASGFVLEFICDFDHAVGFRSIHVAAKSDNAEM